MTLQDEADEFVKRLLVAFIEAHDREPESPEELLEWAVKRDQTILPAPPGKKH